MKILYYFLEYDTPMFYWQRVHIVDELSRNGYYVDTFNPLLYHNIDEANEKLKEHILNNPCDLFFTNVCFDKVLYPSTLEFIHKMGIPALCFRADNLKIPYSDSGLAQYFDLVWLTARETQYIYDKWGVKTIVLPYAANPYTFRYIDVPTIERRVCFIGNPYGSRPRMINALTNNNLPLDAFCLDAPMVLEHNFTINYEAPTISRLKAYYDRLRFKEGRIMTKGAILNRIHGTPKLEKNDYIRFKNKMNTLDLHRIYSLYALSLSSTSVGATDVLANPLKEINLRNFEIPMSGGIQICRYNPELTNYFEDGKEIIFYENNDDLIEKTAYYLNKADDTELKNIKAAARLRSENEHTWMNRFNIIFNELGIDYKKNK